MRFWRQVTNTAESMLYHCVSSWFNFSNMKLHLSENSMPSQAMPVITMDKGFKIHLHLREPCGNSSTFGGYHKTVREFIELEQLQLSV